MGKNSSKVSTLPKENLEYLLKRTNITAKEIKHWYRIYMRECPSGKLNKEQFCKIYAELSPSGKHSPLYEHIFRTYDQDSSGHIDFVEFIEAINVTRSSKPEDKLRMAFRLYDVDQNGCIELQEMVQVMKAVDIYLKDRRVQPKALQTLAGAEPSPELDRRVEQRAHKIFDMVDKNEDGFVTVDELVNVCLRNPDVYNMVISTSKHTKKPA